MKATMKLMFVLTLILGFTTNGFSQRKHAAVIVKHKPAKKVVYVKTPKKAVKPKIGSIVYQLPQKATPVVYRKANYVRCDNVYYTKVKINGKWAYKAVRYA